MLNSAFYRLQRAAFFVMCACVIGLAVPASAQDATADESEAMVRINRLENMMRQMQGQIEELQFSNQKLQEQLKFMTQNGGASAPAGQPSHAAPAQSAPVSQTQQKAGDVPAAVSPQTNAGPINLLAAGKSPLPQGAVPQTPSGPGAPPMTLEQAAAAAAAGQTPQAAAPAPVAPQAPQQPVEKRSNFEIAKDLMAAKDFEKAANVLTGIVEGNPSEPKIPDATMMLGDAQYRLKRYPEAAQRYLKLAQTYPKHPEAPMAFVRLGLSLNEMGQKTQACATFAEFSKRYPKASTAVKAEADRGRKAASCG